MLLVPLVLLSVVAGLGCGQEQCWCTKSYQEILAAPSLEAPTVSTLPAGSCLNKTAVETVGPWLRVKDGYIVDTGQFYLGDCKIDFSPKRRNNNDCGSHCDSCCSRRAQHHSHDCDHCWNNCCWHHSSIAWSDWGACSVSCGGGQRTRHCLSNCNGHHQEHEDCNKDNCPQWSAYSSCSVTCGSGTQIRHCWNHCHALHHSTQSRDCNDGHCPPVWSYYGACSVTCGSGIESRHCLTNCDGVSHPQTQACHRPACLPVWSHYGACSVTCGSGTESRHCLENCHGVHHPQTQDCHKQACLPVWSGWSNCPVTCGVGQRVRHCQQHCTHTEEHQDCTMEPCPVDGQWSAWIQTGCSVSCGTGTISHFRYCNNPKPSHNGADCSHADHGYSYTESCTRPCYSSHSCDKFGTIQSLAELNTTSKVHCADRYNSDTEDFVITHCPTTPNNTNQWHKGPSVISDCQGQRTISRYTPVGTFVNDQYHQPPSSSGVSGIFIGCTTNGFRIATKACGGGAEVIEVPHPGNASFVSDAIISNNPIHYFAVQW